MNRRFMHNLKRWDVAVSLAIRHQRRARRGQPRAVKCFEIQDGRLHLVIRWGGAFTW